MYGTKATDRGAYHVIRGDEGVVDGDELDILALEGDPGHEPADPSETWANTDAERTHSDQAKPHQTRPNEQEK